MSTLTIRLPDDRLLTFTREYDAISFDDITLTYVPTIYRIALDDVEITRAEVQVILEAHYPEAASRITL